jgi:hypothetical protein
MIISLSSSSESSRQDGAMVANCGRFMAERKCDVLVVLTSFKDANTGLARRQIAFITHNQPLHVALVMCCFYLLIY